MIISAPSFPSFSSYKNFFQMFLQITWSPISSEMFDYKAAATEGGSNTAGVIDFLWSPDDPSSRPVGQAAYAYTGIIKTYFHMEQLTLAM